MVLLQELLGLACPSPILSHCTPPKDPLEGTRHSKGSFSGPPTTMALAQPLIKGHTGGLPSALALYHRPTEQRAPRPRPMLLCLLTAGLHSNALLQIAYTSFLICAAILVVFA